MMWSRGKKAEKINATKKGEWKMKKKNLTGEKKRKKGNKITNRMRNIE